MDASVLEDLLREAFPTADIMVDGADGVHMVMTVSNQNYALGGRIAYYWSPDCGDTWFGHPDDVGPEPQQLHLRRARQGVEL